MLYVPRRRTKQRNERRARAWHEYARVNTVRGKEMLQNLAPGDQFAQNMAWLFHFIFILKFNFVCRCLCFPNAPDDSSNHIRVPKCIYRTLKRGTPKNAKTKASVRGQESRALPNFLMRVSRAFTTALKAATLVAFSFSGRCPHLSG